jgi:outer membrane protein
MKLKFGLAVAAGTSALALLAASASAETLADALALAYQTNPTLQQQRAQQRALDESVVQARAGYRPSADLGASTAVRNQGVNGTFATFDSLGLSADVVQNLYTGGRVTAGVRAAEAEILSGREQLRSVENDLFQAVIQAYVDVRRDEAALALREDNVAVLRRQLEETRARFEVGEITRTDVAQAEARLAETEALRAQAQAQLAISRANYTTVVGQAPGTLAPEPTLASIPPGIQQAFDVAEGNSPVLRAAAFTEQAAAARVAAARADLRPSVQARGNAGYNRELSNSDLGQYTTNLGGTVGLSYPLFTGGLTTSRIREARERENAARIQIETQRRNVLQRVSQSWNQMQASRAALVANEEQVRAARVAFEGVRAEQQVGLRTTLDVLNAQQELRNAELALLQSRRNAYVAGAALLNAMGVLEARNLTPDVEIYDPKDSYNRIRRAGAVPWEPLIESLDQIGAPRIAEPRPALAAPSTAAAAGVAAAAPKP